MSTVPSPFTELDLPIPFPDVELLETDGEPLETDWHRYAINVLTESIRSHLWGRTDFYVGGNMFIYYGVAEARKREFRGPDFFFVQGAALEPPRRYWTVWDEGGRYPDVIIELLSESTAKVDRTTKKDLYQNVFRTTDYFCYDHEDGSLEGWTLRGRTYEPLVPNEQGLLWSKELGLWVGPWVGPYQGIQETWLRFFTPDHTVVALFTETERARAEAQTQRAKKARRKEKTERAKAEAQRQRADELAAEVESKQAKAEAERQRADELAAEVARLTAELAAQKKKRRKS